MKYIFSKYSLLILVMMACYGATYAQRKPSQLSFASEVNKIQQKKAARDKFIRQNKEQEAKLNANAGKSTTPARQQSSIAPASTLQTPAGKPSERPITVPRRPKRD